MDTTTVSPLRRDGTARPKAADHDGAVFGGGATPEGKYFRRALR